MKSERCEKDVEKGMRRKRNKETKEQRYKERHTHGQTNTQEVDNQ